MYRKGEYMKKYKCLACGVEFEVYEGQEIECPVCGATKDQCEEVKD